MIGSRQTRRTRCRAFSLLETVAATLIVGVVMVAALQTLGAFIRGQQRIAVRGRGWLLAQEMMAEVLEKTYEDPDEAVAFGSEPAEIGGGRGQYDDVDDYAGWDSSPPQSRDGTEMPDLENWRRTVDVVYTSADDPTTPVGSDQGVKRITVTVDFRNKTVATLQSVRARAWQEPPFD